VIGTLRSIIELSLSISQEASAIPFAALTAWRALHGTARISEGYV
jgi:NADPH:quinone reductase-like Zn-dependent oxidoreductase